MIEKKLTNLDGTPWYKQFWAWFVLAPLFLIVGVCSVLISVAYSLNTDVVSDNYHKEGRMLTARFEATEYARDLGLKGFIYTQNNNVFLEIESADPVYAPNVLLYLSHPFEKKQDETIMLKQVRPALNSDATQRKSNQYFYTAALTKPITGKRYVRASYYNDTKNIPTLDDAELEIWRINGEGVFDEVQTSATFSLTP